MPRRPLYFAVATSCQRLPARIAPVLLITSSATRLGPDDLNAHSIASSGPAMNPSSDIVMCHTTRLTSLLLTSKICHSRRWWGFGAFSAAHTHHLAKRQSRCYGFRSLPEERTTPT